MANLVRRRWPPVPGEMGTLLKQRLLRVIDARRMSTCVFTVYDSISATRLPRRSPASSFGQHSWPFGPLRSFEHWQSVRPTTQ